MIEYYGWLNVRSHQCEPDTDTMLRTAEEVMSVVAKIEYEHRILQAKWMNGNFVVCTAGSTNHRSRSVEQVIELFKTVSQLAPSSYGVLYLYDDEASGGTSDEFQILKVAKGKWSVEKDQLLSPLSVQIEDC